MGVPGLWRELSPAYESTLECITWNNAHIEPGHVRLWRVGVDASQWMFHARKSRGGVQPELRTLFFRLARLLALPIDPIFVFDGAARPSIKRDAHVYHTYQPLEEAFCSLVTLMGFSHWRAYAEAEAELAWMNSHGLIDAVLTDDVDALMFGAQCVVRRDTESEKEIVSVYEKAQIAKQGLDRDAMVLTAILSGGDYDTHGLGRCGIKTALGLARAGHAHTLLSAFRSVFPKETDVYMSKHDWDARVAGWCVDVSEELRTNKHGHLPRCQPKLADTLHKSFLCSVEARQHLYDYVWPKTSECDQKQHDRLVRFVKSRHARLDLAALVKSMQRLFRWSADLVFQRCERTLMDGVYVRRLIMHASSLQEKAMPSLSPNASPVHQVTDFFSNMRVKPPEYSYDIHGMRTHEGRTELRISYQMQAFMDEVSQALGVESKAFAQRRIWLPTSLLLALPDAQRVRTYLSVHTESSILVKHKQTKLTSYMTSTKPSLNTNSCKVPNKLRSKPYDSPTKTPTKSNPNFSQIKLYESPSKTRNETSNTIRPLKLFTSPTSPPHELVLPTPCQSSVTPDSSCEIVRVVSTDVIVLSDTSS